MGKAEKIEEVMGRSSILVARARSVDDLKKTISRGLRKRAVRITVAKIYSSSERLARDLS